MYTIYYSDFLEFLRDVLMIVWLEF